MKTLRRWFRIGLSTAVGAFLFSSAVAGADPAELSPLQFRLLARETDRGPVDELPQKGPEDKSRLRVLKDVVLDGTEVDKVRLQKTETGKFELVLKLTPAGARKFERVTAANVGRKLAIVFDEKILATPEIKERIPQGEVTIQLNQSEADGQKLVNAINAAAGKLNKEPR